MVLVVLVEMIGYFEGWEMQNYWLGEYLNVFVVMQEGVIVFGYEIIIYQEYLLIYCGLLVKVIYSLWNFVCVESDDLYFVVMIYLIMFMIQEDIIIEVFQDEGVLEFSFSVGDVLIYKFYFVEGFFIVEKDGVLYEMNEVVLFESMDFE